MTYNIKENIEEYLVKIPREAQEAIRSFDWISIVNEIGKKNDFNEEEIVDLQVETALVLVNIAPVDTLNISLENQFGLTKEDALNITEDITNKIFIPISKIVSDKIANQIKDKNLDWGQNLNFILTGGDYLTTLEKTKYIDAPKPTNSADDYIENQLINNNKNE